MRLRIEYRYIGDYDIPGDWQDARKAINLLAWRIRDLPPYRGAVMAVGTTVIDGLDEVTETFDVTAESDDEIESWASSSRSLDDGESFCEVMMHHYATRFFVVFSLAVRDGHLEHAHALVSGPSDMDIEKVSEEIMTLMPGRILPIAHYPLSDVPDDLAVTEDVIEF